MELIQAKNVFNRLDRLVNVVNTTIGVIKANYEVLNYNQIVFHLFYEKDTTNLTGYFSSSDIYINNLDQINISYTELLEEMKTYR